ncbi:MAG TPA: hypothetical protein VG435_12705 [Acidimicrobiales bacterium]|jgi:hypothetical protein|nr:hypothetical protein [Acidimicrobiales bacterium]
MAKKPTGRVTPPKRAVAQAAPPARPEKWEIDQSRIVKSPWGWRAVFIMALLEIGVALIMSGNHHATLAVFWLVISAGWVAGSIGLWRKHRKYMDS